jgi:ATP-dependent DNA helicase DinG
MSLLADQTRAALSEDGALVRRLNPYQVREAQITLSTSIAETIDDRDVLVAEAGTGTGKTFAYLVPAILSGQRTIISTGTRALQDQLYHRDLPRVKTALGVGLKTALLKGRANYLCHYRMQQAKGESFASREIAAQFQTIVSWSGKTQRGDLAELNSIPDDSPVRGVVTSTAENCIGSECPFWSECFVVRARQEAQAADLVVVNHHLLLADLAIKQEGFGEILPGANTFILDEAHQLPELAAQFFGEGVSARQLQDVARDVLLECKNVTGAIGSLQNPVRSLEHAVRALRAAVDKKPARGAQQRLLDDRAVDQAFDELTQTLETLHMALGSLAESSPGMETGLARVDQYLNFLRRWLDQSETDASEEMPVRWYEITQRGFRLQSTPLDVSAPLRRYREQSHASWIFTSATLAIEGGMQHIAEKLGLDEPRTLLQQSPFRWQEQALCYLPKNLPEPNVPHYTRAVIDIAKQSLNHSQGRAFLLFTSHRALREASEALKDGPWPLFVQGSAPKLELLERFRASGNGVLLGAASFWEGVDVAGDALSLVLIDKLPFAAPDDPVLEARLNAVRRRGGNPFFEEQLPQAIIALKQGVGRLIRSFEDRGVLVLCDPRISSKGYGRSFLSSLPPMKLTRSLDDVEQFFAVNEAERAS